MINVEFDKNPNKKFFRYKFNEKIPMEKFFKLESLSHIFPERSKNFNKINPEMLWLRGDSKNNTFKKDKPKPDNGAHLSGEFSNLGAFEANSLADWAPNLWIRRNRGALIEWARKEVDSATSSE